MIGPCADCGRVMRFVRNPPGLCDTCYRRGRKNGTVARLHDRLRPDAEFIRSRVTVDPETGCWLWTGRLLPNGYGSVMPMRDPSRLAHRLSYRTFVGPIPDGYQVDHVATRGCKYRHCTNPEHLEAVTPRENTLRSGAITAVNAAKTECIHGHPFDEANTYHYRGERACRTCRRLRERKYRADALRPAPT